MGYMSVWKRSPGRNFLIQTLNERVKRDFVYDETAREYQESLRPEKFGKAYLGVYQQLMEKRNGRKYEVF